MTIPGPKDTYIVMAAMPAYGHIRPIKALARVLHKLEYPITFLTAPRFRGSIESIGVEFVPFGGKATISHEDFNTVFPKRQMLPKGPEIVLHDMEHFFLALIPDQHEALQTVLGRDGLKKKKVVMVGDSTVTGTWPMLHGAFGRRVPVIAIGPVPIVLMSKDTPPFGMAMLSRDVEKNPALNGGAGQIFAPIDVVLQRYLTQYSCIKQRPSDFVMDSCDLPSHIRYVGTMLGSNDEGDHPGWFDSFVVQDTSKPLIFVTSGSLPTMRSSELIEPAIKACADLPVRVVVCRVFAELPDDFPVPENARVAEWISFENLLPHTDVVVSNCSCGTLGQAFAASVPMVVGGQSEDKAECCVRAEATGAAINLRTQAPTVAQVKEALVTMLNTRSYKRKAMELKEYTRYDPVKSVVQAIDEVNGKDFCDSAA